MASRTAHQAILQAVLDAYASGSHGISLFQFPSGQTILPSINKEGSYLTATACFPMIKGKDPLPENATLPNRVDDIKRYGDTVIGYLEIAYNWDGVRLAAEMEKIKAKLLEVARATTE